MPTPAPSILANAAALVTAAPVEIVSDFEAVIFIVELIALAVYLGWSIRNRRFHLLNKLYLGIAGSFSIWAIAILGMKFTDPGDIQTLFVLDCITSIANFIPALSLCIAIVFVLGGDYMPKWCRLLFVVPTLSILVSATNPLHRLQYEVFSVIKTDIVFGPYFYVTGTHSYLTLLAGAILMINFAIKNRSKLYLLQSLMFSLAFLIPLVISVYATFSSSNVPISVTPLGFTFAIVFSGIAIGQLHLLDIQPIATQRILNWISDGYLILSNTELVIAFNKPFNDVFASSLGIAENRYLRSRMKESDISENTSIYNMLNALDACRRSMTTITYEQSVLAKSADGLREFAYMTEVTPLIVNDKLTGFVFIFKDVTQLKKSMAQLQESQSRLLEQKNFAFLGQMIAGITHNLKTPIMGISGCLAATESLIDECESSLSDPQVTDEDYREIYQEVREWFGKVRESVSYMSDIITAIKGQAATISDYGASNFSVDELVKRTRLLMRQEFASYGCTLNVQLDAKLGAKTIQGDVNNLTQVLNNLLSNAIYAQAQTSGGSVSLKFFREADNLLIHIIDTGPGIPPDVRENLFKKMVTSKGAKGSGLGLYISQTVVRSRFSGSIWVEASSSKGTTFAVKIPLTPD